MKQFISLVVGMMIATTAFSQKVTDTEAFDGIAVSYVSTPANAWTKNSTYFTSTPYSYRGAMPHQLGDSIVLTTPVFDFSSYDYVQLQFNHICKVSPRDKVIVEYQISGQQWQKIPVATYRGKASNYDMTGFNALSYPEWEGNDSTAIPASWWWKEETFDISAIVNKTAGVQFRFILKRGNTQGSHISYGWLLDDVKISSSHSEIGNPVVAFLPPLIPDTVYKTGTFEVTARVKPTTPIPLEIPTLRYTAHKNGVTVAEDSIAMTSVSGDSLWKAALPLFEQGTLVNYAVTAKDTTGNKTTTHSKYYITMLFSLNNSVALSSLDMPDTVQVFPLTQVPVIATIKNTGAANLLSTNIHWSINGGAVQTKAWTGNLPWDFERQDTVGYYTPTINGNDSLVVWVSLPNGQYDTVSADDTLVKVIYGNTDIHISFVNAPTDTVKNTGPFAINARIRSLSGTAIGQVSLDVLTSYLGGTATPASLPMTYHAADGLWKATIPHTLWGSRVTYSISLTDINSNVINVSNSFYIDLKDLSTDSNSVALERIVSPNSRNALSNTTVAVTAQVRNKGIKDLTSCNINWSKNGVLQSPTTVYSRVLPSDFTDTITIGSYVPVTEQRDTIVVWVSTPNGEIDPVLTDDTLHAFPIGCDGTLTGIRTVGANADFPTMAAVLDLIFDCGLAGDLILQLKGTLNESINLARISPYMNGYHLTVTSSGNHVDSAVVRVASGDAVVIGNNSNLTIKALTIDAGTGSGIRFTAACNNVTVRDCKILTDTTATASIAPIVKATNTGVVDSVFIINNTLIGGYYGILFYGGTGTGAYGTNIVIDSNKLNNQYYYGINIYNSNWVSCSYNAILSRITSTGDYWQGLRLNNANGLVIGNRIIQRSNAITRPHGIYLSNYHTYNTTDTGLVANNEIIVNVTDNDYYGLYASSSRAAIYHNSIYMSGSATTAALNINVSSNDFYSIKNNNLVSTSFGAYPIRLSTATGLSRYDIDNNNMYAPQYVGFVGNNKATIAEWQQTVTTDTRSISILPSFVDPAKSLELTNYVPFYTSYLQDLSTDIANVSRIGVTALGCYHGIAVCNVNASLLDLTGCNSGMLSGMEDTVKVVLSNLTITPVAAATLGWSYNGTPQPAVSWSGNLTVGQRDTVVLGTITHSTSGRYTVSAWINSLGGLTDENPQDDTITTSGLICSTPYAGVYSVGTAGSDFPSLSAAFEIFASCGLADDVVLEMQSGTYEESINLAAHASLFGNNTLTITSVTHKAEDVTFVTKNVGIILANNNIVIKDITVDATEGKYAIQFINACTNIVVRNCRLLSNPTATAAGTAPVYKAASTGIVDSIFFINNLLDGGYEGFFFRGGTGTGVGQYGTNVVFDSNTVSNQYFHGISPQWLNYISCSYNTVLARTSINNSWSGIRVYYVNGPVIGNRIIQRTSIPTPALMYIAYYHYANTQDTGLIANNELIGNTSGGYAMDLNNSKTRILHNSIYTSGSGSMYGIYVRNSPVQWAEIKNNNIVMESSTAYPIYMLAAFNLNQYDINSNNMYAPQYVGYAGGAAKATLAEWRQTVTSDTRSVSVNPSFIDKTQDLQLATYTPLLTTSIAEVTHDIAGLLRFGGITAMGCYHGLTLYSANGTLTDLHGGREGLIAGQQDTMKVLLFNGGTTPLTSVNIGWSHNNVTLPPVSWSGNLALGETDTVVLGTITHSTSGRYTVSAWINNLGGLTDELHDDDTVSMSNVTCDSPLSGTYTIGANGEFLDIQQAFEMFNFCTVGGDIVFEIETGTYNQDINLSNINTLLNGNKLTFTSATHNADDVVFVSTGTGVTLGNSNNIVLKDLTIDARAGNYTIRFLSACTNVVIRNCKLLADTTTTSSSKNLIHKASGTGVVDSIFIINNLLDGGYNGFNFYGGTGTGAGAYGTNVIFDSNTVSNQYYYGINSYYTDFISCSYNTFLTRTANVRNNGDYYNMRIYNSNGDIIGNRIIQRSNAIIRPYGIYLYYHNLYNTEKVGLVANNEIIMYATGTTNAIAMSYSRLKVLHNSIYVSGSGSPAGIYTGGAPNEWYEIKNNNITMASDGAVPISLFTTDYIHLYDIDNNNMYAPTYVGRTGTANKTTIADWQQVVTTDKHSIRVQPSFVDSTQHLKLNDYTPFKCDIFPLVDRDIEDSVRSGAFTAMGAYHGFSHLPVNASLAEIVNMRSGDVLGEHDDIDVVLYNTGISPLTKAKISWTFNGVSQPSVSWTGSLAYGESTPVRLGQITYDPLINTVKVWIDSLGTLTDIYAQDDTISMQQYVCAGHLRGVYNIGTAAGNNFATLTDALDRIKLCGIDSTTVFVLQADTYRYDIDLSGVRMTGDHTLTITSATHDARDVVFVTRNIGITLSNSRNIILKDITVDATKGVHAVQFTDACTGIAIRGCRLFVNPTITDTYPAAVAAICKETGTGIADSITIVGNLLDGGYDGFRFYAGTGTGVDQYGTHIIFDSNTVSNQRHDGFYARFAVFTSCSYNTIIGRTSNTLNSWAAMRMYYSNGTIVGNRISQPTDAILNPVPVYIDYCNLYNTTDAGLFANNEIIMKSTGTNSAIFVNHSRLKILHNSIYTTYSASSSGSKQTRGINLANSNTWIEVKNNNIVMGSPNAYPIYLDMAFDPSKHDFDYNNMYAPVYVGFIDVNNVSTIADWQQTVTSDLHSFSILPPFTNTVTDLKLSSPNRYLCPRLSEVSIDIEDVVRPALTSVGSYTQPAVAHDAMLKGITNWEERYLKDQELQVAVDLLNLCDNTPVSTVTFGWSVNNVPQADTVLTLSPVIQPYNVGNIVVGSFITPATDTVKVSVWIKSINGQADVIKEDDTASAVSVREVLAAFAPPFVTDTVSTLHFTVNTFIHTQTGAPAVTPKMYFHTTVNNDKTFYDSVVMVQDGDIWKADIPTQYYNSKVVYTTTISDLTDNSITLTDSTFIQYTNTSNDKYAGHNLSIFELTDPVNLNIGGNACSEAHKPLKIVLINTGENDYDFAVDSVSLHVEVSNAITRTYSKTLATDMLLSGESDTIEIEAAFPVFMPGQYDIKVWLTSVADGVSFDDTLWSVYMSERLGVPIADNFSGSVSSDFVIQAVNTPAKWTVVSQGTDADTVVKPVYGTGMLAFTGSRGAMSYLSTRQLELTGTVLPVLEFWYFHDTVASDDYMDVLVTRDGGSTYTVLKSVFKQDINYGWKQYSIHLAPYVGGQCMNILFEAMQMTSQVTQYIDSINITAKQDIAIKEVLVPELTACDLENKAWRVVLENLADPMIDYTKNPTQITLEIAGTLYRFEQSLNSGALQGLSLDTITLSPTMNLDTGTYNMTVYFTSAIDENPLNDTLKTKIVLKPNMDIQIKKMSTGVGNPVQAEIECNQEVTITNTGNIELSNITLVVEVLDGSGFTDTIRMGHSLLPNSTETVVFNKAYSVAWQPQYDVKVMAYLECDPVKFKWENSVQENVNMTDVYIVDIIHPADNTFDMAGSSINVSLHVQNRNLGDMYNEDEIKVGILIKDEDGNLLSSVDLEGLPEIGMKEMIEYTFKGAYTVPHAIRYFLTVYLNSEEARVVDVYSTNDTMTRERMTGGSTLNRKGISFTMEQNIPNPTAESTRIHYSVPQDGEVVFHLYSVSGQLLYTMRKNVALGSHQIDLNLSEYAAGVYFYSMEYKGQRLVKRMNIKH